MCVVSLQSSVSLMQALQIGLAMLLNKFGIKKSKQLYFFQQVLILLSST